jgi:hypothetical protein
MLSSVRTEGKQATPFYPKQPAQQGVAKQTTELQLAQVQQTRRMVYDHDHLEKSKALVLMRLSTLMPASDGSKRWPPRH